MTRRRFIDIYGLVALATLIYVLFLDGFVYSHGNWMTQLPAAILAALLWPLYWVWALAI